MLADDPNYRSGRLAWWLTWQVNGWEKVPQAGQDVRRLHDPERTCLDEPPLDGPGSAGRVTLRQSSLQEEQRWDREDYTHNRPYPQRGLVAVAFQTPPHNKRDNHPRRPRPSHDNPIRETLLRNPPLIQIRKDGKIMNRAPHPEQHALRRQQLRDRRRKTRRNQRRRQDHKPAHTARPAVLREPGEEPVDERSGKVQDSGRRRADGRQRLFLVCELVRRVVLLEDTEGEWEAPDERFEDEAGDEHEPGVFAPVHRRQLGAMGADHREFLHFGDGWLSDDE